VRSEARLSEAAGSGGWFDRSLPSRSWAHLFRSNIHPIQGSETRTDLNHNRQKQSACLLRKSSLTSRPDFLERVGRSRHRRCDPGRAHRLLHPRANTILNHSLSAASNHKSGGFLRGRIKVLNQHDFVAVLPVNYFIHEFLRQQNAITSGTHPLFLA
jgi:hypothetical protein